MSTATISLAFKEFARAAQREEITRNIHMAAAGKSKPILHLALLYREQLRFPSSSEWLLRILSGKAWVSFSGQDYLLESGDNLTVPEVKNGAIISAIGSEALFFEIT